MNDIFKKIIEWAVTVFGVAIIIFSMWLIGTDGSVDVLANHLGNWGAVALVVAVFAFWFWAEWGDNK